jgi:hypothetical protein
MRSLLLAVASVATVALLGACAQPTVEEETQASEDLLVTDDGLGRDVEVSADALTVTRTGHESLLDLPAGKLIVGRRGGAKNPDGFLRRVSSVTTEGSKIVIHTEGASLSEAIVTGDLHEASSPALADPGSSDMSLGPREFGGLLGGKIDISNAVVLDERDIGSSTGAVSASGVKLAAHAEVTSGYIDFRPRVETDLHFAHRKLEHFRVSATADLDAKFEVDIDVKGEGTVTTELSHSVKTTKKKQLIKFPRMRLPPQFIGPVPVYEAIELAVVIGCDFTIKGDVHVRTGLQVSGHFSAGADYGAHGWQKLGSAPTFKVTPTFDATTAGNLEVSCGLTPQVSVLFYDMAGPTLSIGPYISTEVDNTSGSLKWGVHPGVHADLAAELSLFDRSIASSSISIFDWKSDKPLLGNAD